MSNTPTQKSKTTWQTILVNPLIFGALAIPVDNNSSFALIAVGVTVAFSGLIVRAIPRVPISVSIACGIMFTLGCGIGGFGLVNILERQFPGFPTLEWGAWGQYLPSIFENVAILAWIFIVLNIAPVTRSLFISTILVAAAAGYSLTSDVLLLREALTFGVPREIADWEKAVEFLLSGCALTTWARLIIRKLATRSSERITEGCVLFVGVTMTLCGIFLILRDIFS